MVKSRVQREKAKHRTGLIKRLTISNAKYKHPPKIARQNVMDDLIKELEIKLR
jgi:hypothetical protein